MKLKVLTALVIFYSSCVEKEKLTFEDFDKAYSTTHFDYFTHSDDYIDTTWQEKYIRWLLAELNIKDSGKIEYYKVQSKEKMVELFDFEMNGYAKVDSNQLFTIWPKDNHECVHLIVCRNIGCPPALFGEGMAVAYQANFVNDSVYFSWNGMDLNILAKRYLENNKIPPLDSLMGIESFWKYDMNILYPISGSFTRFLINKHGIENFKGFIQGKEYLDSSAVIKSAFLQAFKVTIYVEWQNWITMLKEMKTDEI